VEGRETVEMSTDTIKQADVNNAAWEAGDTLRGVPGSRSMNRTAPRNLTTRNNGEFLVYQTDDGRVKLDVRLEHETLWLTQKAMAELFGVGVPAISKHLKNIFENNELEEKSVVSILETTAADGKQYETLFYNLDAIISVGYRVKSITATRFRIWATQRLKEYIIKGFVMDDERLKNPPSKDLPVPDYFDEMLERIRDIRASEKRFYQKVRDLYATAIDYDKQSEQAQVFFKKVQNKMLWAVTGKTSAELIADRSNPQEPNMGLTTWQGDRMRKGDVAIAKNYLNEQEVRELNRIVTMYLDHAEDQAAKRRTVTMEQWEAKLDAFLQFNDRDLLTHAGTVEAAVAKRLAESRYEEFDADRRKAEVLEADAEDMREIEDVARRLERRGTGRKA